MTYLAPIGSHRNCRFHALALSAAALTSLFGAGWCFRKQPRKITSRYAQRCLQLLRRLAIWCVQAGKTKGIITCQRAPCRLPTMTRYVCSLLAHVYTRYIFLLRPLGVFTFAALTHATAMITRRQSLSRIFFGRSLACPFTCRHAWVWSCLPADDNKRAAAHGLGRTRTRARPTVSLPLWL